MGQAICYFQHEVELQHCCSRLIELRGERSSCSKCNEGEVARIGRAKENDSVVLLMSQLGGSFYNRSGIADPFERASLLGAVLSDVFGDTHIRGIIC
jgi:hypothetical protein